MLSQLLHSYVSILVLCLGALVIKVAYDVFLSPLRKIPGPWHTTWTNLSFKWANLSGQQVYHIHNLHKKYGPIVRLAPDVVAVVDFDSYQRIYKVNSGFLKTEWDQQITSPIRPGIFMMRDPKEHAARRKLMAQPFAKSSLRSRWEVTVVAKAKLAVTGIMRDIEQSKQADLHRWSTLFTSDTAVHILFGESFGMLESGEKDAYLKLFDEMLFGCGMRMEFPILSLLGYLPLQKFQIWFNNRKMIGEFGRKAVENARRSGTKANIFTQMIAEAEKEGTTLDDLDLMLEAGNLIVGGTDTTSITLTYAIWCVFSDEKLRHALEDEIKRLPDNFTDADMEKLPLLNATLEETCRLYGAVPIYFSRYTPPEGAYFHGHFIPHGIKIGTHAWSMHRSPELWEDPEKFDPYRFLNNPTKHLAPGVPAPASQKAQPNPMAAFGAGSRICLGIHLAWMELRYGLAYVLKECSSLELSPLTTPESMEPENYIAIMPKSHRCLVVPRKNSTLAD